MPSFSPKRYMKAAMPSPQPCKPSSTSSLPSSTTSASASQRLCSPQRARRFPQPHPPGLLRRSPIFLPSNTPYAPARPHRSRRRAPQSRALRSAHRTRAAWRRLSRALDNRVRERKGHGARGCFCRRGESRLQHPLHSFWFDHA